MRNISAVAAAAALAFLAGCSSGAEAGGSGDVAPEELTQSSTPDAGSAASTSSGAALGATQFATRVEQDDTVVVDVRSAEEFAQGHLAGALNIDVTSEDFSAQVAELSPDTRYAVYCRTGSRSAQAMDIMLEQGFTDVAHLDGGIKAWEAAGGEVVTDP